MAKLPKNAQAIKEWIEKNRPDMVAEVDFLLTQNAFILVSGIGFEAGRQFQKENPDLELNSPSVYLD